MSQNILEFNDEKQGKAIGSGININYYVPKLLQNQKNHPANLLGSNQFYFSIQDKNYKNYKYERKRLRNTEFEFLMYLPLDEMNECIIPKDARIDEDKKVDVEKVIERKKGFKKNDQILNNCENEYYQIQYNENKRRSQQNTCLKQLQDYRLCPDIKQKKLKQLDQQIKFQNTAQKPKTPQNLWTSPLNQYQEDQRWGIFSRNENTRTCSTQNLKYTSQGRQLKEQSQEQQNLMKCLSISRQESRKTAMSNLLFSQSQRSLISQEQQLSNQLLQNNFVHQNQIPNEQEIYKQLNNKMIENKNYQLPNQIISSNSNQQIMTQNQIKIINQEQLEKKDKNQIIQIEQQLFKQQENFNQQQQQQMKENYQDQLSDFNDDNQYEEFLLD